MTSKTCESVGSTIETATLDEVTRRLWEQEETATKDYSPEELDGDWNAVRAGVATILSGVVDARGEEQTNGDAELVARDNGATNLAWCDFAHVQNDDGRDETDTKTSNDTTSDEQFVLGRGSLHDASNGVDNAASEDGGSAAEEVGQVTSDDGAEEGTERQEGHDHGLLPGRKREAGWLLLSWSWVRLAGVLVDDVWH